MRVENPDGVAREIGTLTRSERFVDGQSANVWARIQWDEDAAVRPNAYSGDVVSPGPAGAGGSDLPLRRHHAAHRVRDVH